MVMRILTGIQPTGKLHIGNYFSAIKGFLNMQNRPECKSAYFLLVDGHSITRTFPEKGEITNKNTLETAATILASGLDPQKTTLFRQSQVSAHFQLAWLLSKYTKLSDLKDMIQFKTAKRSEKTPNVSFGLFYYPVLQAADILLYSPSHVPIGSDQKQHLELARSIAGRFNRVHSKEVFKIPAPLFPEKGSRVMSLTEPFNKMSKSCSEEFSRINLMDDESVLVEKCRNAFKISGNGGNKDIIMNLVEIFNLMAETPKYYNNEMIRTENVDIFQEEFVELMVKTLKPIREKTKEILNDKSHLERILKDGKEKASSMADGMLKEVKEVM